MNNMFKPTGEFIFVRSDDWEGLYRDGKLVVEGHDITYDEILVALGVFDVIKEKWIDGTSREEKLNEVGRLPKTLNELESW